MPPPPSREAVEEVAPVAAPAARPSQARHKLVVVDTERSSGPDVTRPVDLYPRRLGGACSPGAGDRATSLPAVDAVLERRNPSRPIRRPRSVAGQPQRDGSERARRRRQELGRLHGLLGPRDAHDQSRVAVCLSAHPAGVSDGAVRRIAALQAAVRLNVSIPSRSAAIARCAMRSVSSMVVDNFNPGRTFGRPPEADPPLNVGQLGGTRSARCQSDLDGICPLTRSPTPRAASDR